MGLSTKDVKTGGDSDFVNKTIQPGNMEAKLNSIELHQPSFLQADNGYYLILNLETKKPSDNFEGFLLDKDNPEAGRYEGQVGRVKASKWPYRDATTKSGIEISRDNEIMKVMKNLCENLKLTTWWKKVDQKYDTIEDFIEGFNNDAPYKDKYIHFCVCGKEYYNKSNYIAYDLHLPKYSKEGIGFSKDSDKVLEFDADKHIDHAQKPAEVEEFGKSNDVPTEFEL